MARFVKGDVVVIPFPFSDLSQAKRRPALIVASDQGDDLILCQIASQLVRDEYAIAVSDDDFATGSLPQSSNIRLNCLFTADQQLVLYQVACLKPEKTNAARQNCRNFAAVKIHCATTSCALVAKNYCPVLKK